MDNRSCNNFTLQAEIDKLSEVGNIGAGNAATSLSKMLGKRIDINIAKLQLKHIGEFHKMLGNEESYTTAMITEVHGDINGLFLLAFEIESTKEFIHLILDKQIASIEEIEELDSSLLCETGNILGGAYLSALASLTQLEINPSVPHLAIDMAGAILGFAAIAFTKEDDEIVFLEAKFVENENLVNGTYLLMLDRASFDRILEALNNLI